MTDLELLRRIDPNDAARASRTAVDSATLEAAAAILADVRARGVEAVRAHGERLGDLQPSDPLVVPRADVDRALDAISREAREALERCNERVTRFATAQRAALKDIDVAVPGGRAGHRATPVDAAGCYAPGGRFPLPSSVIMTVATARAAGVRSVWVASPRPTRETLAAAAIAGADGVVRVGGAQAIGALAYGAGEIPPCDVVVGPGNRWVTAAKQLISGDVRIDMLAGPSELLVIADGEADPETIAADLLAQAEHDDDAIPLLVTTSATLADAVNEALDRQLVGLATATTARAALRNGWVAVVPDLETAVALSDRVAPEHLQILTRNSAATAASCTRYGAIFVGALSAEVLGDYGAGPNHTLPTGGTARFVGGLSVLDFVAVRTWLEVDDASELARDAAILARLEGLEAHARAAERRLRSSD